MAESPTAREAELEKRIATLEAEVERLQTVIAMRDDEDAAVYRDLEAD